MGPNIVLSMSQAIVRASTTEFPGFIHTDGGQALRQIRVTETSRPLAVKALYLLTDVEGTDCGNFTVFPGSHLRQIPFDSDAAPTPTRRAPSSWAERRAIATCSATRSGTGPRRTIPGKAARHCSTTTRRCS